MDAVITGAEKKNKNRGMVISTIAHIVLILLALMPLLTFPDPPPGQEGILVNLGLPDEGEGDDNAGPTEVAPQEEVQPEPSQPEETKPEPVPVQETKKPEPVKEREVVTTEDPSVIAMRQQKEKEKTEADAKKRAEAEAKRQAEAAEAAKKKAEADARAKAEADAKALKDQLAGGLSGTGGGKGNTGKPGNQGDPGGDPNASKLEGISKGAGKVGGGLGSRGVQNAPRVTENSQAQGTVVLRVCVDANGRVSSADYTQSGSTTSNQQLISAAIKNARSWTFSKGEVDNQCGTITYNFRVE